MAVDCKKQNKAAAVSNTTAEEVTTNLTYFTLLTAVINPSILFPFLESCGNAIADFILFCYSSKCKFKIKFTIHRYRNLPDYDKFCF